MATKRQTVAVLEALDALGFDASAERVIDWAAAHHEQAITPAIYAEVMKAVEARLHEAAETATEPLTSPDNRVESAPAGDFQHNFQVALSAARTLLRVCGGRRAAVDVVNLVADASGESP